MRLHFQNNQRKMDWRCGSSGRVPFCKCKALSSNPTTTKGQKSSSEKIPKELISNRLNAMWHVSTADPGKSGFDVYLILRTFKSR
jgi:hypothetical protein